MHYFTFHSHSNHSSCHLISPLVYIIYPKPCCLIYLDVSLSGYFLEVSPIKTLKDYKRNYSNFSIENDETLHQYVYFFLETHRVFNDIVKGGVNSYIEIKQFCSSIYVK